GGPPMSDIREEAASFHRDSPRRRFFFRPVARMMATGPEHDGTRHDDGDILDETTKGISPGTARRRTRVCPGARGRDTGPGTGRVGYSSPLWPHAGRGRAARRGPVRGAAAA